MKDTIAEKLFQRHLIEGALKQGSEIGLLIDQVLRQDASLIEVLRKIVVI